MYIFKVHANSVKLMTQGHGGVLLQVILMLEIVLLPLQQLELLVQAEVLCNEIAMDDVPMLVLSLDKGGFVIYSRLCVISLPCQACSAGVGIV